jgi:mono/diheme cytochrome c family protein
MRSTKLSVVLGCLLFAVACGDDDDDDTPPPVIDAGSRIDSGSTIDAGDIPTAARGEYLVRAIGSCNDCHTPRLKDGSPDTANFLAGIDCFIDINPGDENVGCLSSRNLTDDASGLKSRSNLEIKNMIAKGTRPDGTALHPFMPYYAYGTFTESDLDSIVLYLRTVPGVAHTVAANQPPFFPAPAAPAPVLAADEMPMPTVVNAATLHGRYLASVACLECHTRRTVEGDSRSLDKTKLYGGGEAFPAALLGLPVPPFPEFIVSRNLTPDTTGIGYTKQQILDALKLGKDKEGKGICPPMPAGMAGFANLTAEDASDIADYILALPPVVNMIETNCEMPEGP